MRQAEGAGGEEKQGEKRMAERTYTLLPALLIQTILGLPAQVKKPHPGLNLVGCVKANVDNAPKIWDGALAYGITHPIKLLAGWGSDEA